MADALANQEMDLAVSAGFFSSRGLRHRGLGEGSNACLIDSKRRWHGTLTVEDYVARNHILVSSGGVVGILDESLAAQSHSHATATAAR